MNEIAALDAESAKGGRNFKEAAVNENAKRWEE